MPCGVDVQDAAAIGMFRVTDPVSLFVSTNRMHLAPTAMYWPLA